MELLTTRLKRAVNERLLPGQRHTRRARSSSPPSALWRGGIQLRRRTRTRPPLALARLEHWSLPHFEMAFASALGLPLGLALAWFTSFLASFLFGIQPHLITFTAVLRSHATTLAACWLRSLDHPRRPCLSVTL
jgi:hypothetical protein